MPTSSPAGKGWSPSTLSRWPTRTSRAARSGCSGRSSVDSTSASPTTGTRSPDDRRARRPAAARRPPWQRLRPARPRARRTSSAWRAPIASRPPRPSAPPATGRASRWRTSRSARTSPTRSPRVPPRSVAAGPVLLVNASNVPGATAAELRRLDPARIVVVGGTSIISPAVASSLAAYATTRRGPRLAGSNRYATAAAISRDAFAPGVPGRLRGHRREVPRRALPGVAAAGSGGGPVLLTKPSELPAETAAELGRLRPGRIVVLGGTERHLAGGCHRPSRRYATSGTSSGSFGDNRYSTAIDVSRETFSAAARWCSWRPAPTSRMPSAAGRSPAAFPGRCSSCPARALPAIGRRRDPAARAGSVVILGGTGVVSAGVEAQIGSLLGD